MRAVRALVLLLLASGCTSHSCAWGPWVATWNDPSLYASFPALGPHGAYEVSRHNPAPGLPFHNGSLEARWGNFSLRTVVWDIPDSLHDPRATDLNLDTGGVVWAILAQNATSPELGRILEPFLRNVTEANASTRSAWEDQFAASRQTGDYYARGFEGARYQVRVAGPFRLDALFARLTGADGTNAVVGRALDRDGWRWLFDVGEVRATRTVEGGTVTLATEPFGSVRFTADHHENPGNERLKQWVDEAYRDLGLGSAPPGAPMFRPSAIC